MTVFRSLSNAVKSNQQFQRLQNAYKDAMGYRRVGLFRDDLIIEEDTVKEALRRLTPQQYQDRTFRFRRALNLSTQQSELPKELWTKPEEGTGDLWICGMSFSDRGKDDWKCKPEMVECDASRGDTIDLARATPPYVLNSRMDGEEVGVEWAPWIAWGCPGGLARATRHLAIVGFTDLGMLGFGLRSRKDVGFGKSKRVSSLTLAIGTDSLFRNANLDLSPQDIPYLTPIINQVHSEVYSAQEFEFLNTVPAELAKRNRA
ncbi:hypothetical protein HK097_006919 [Rhizophlyctis rosea]|uniref:Complex III subunit 7 n=1 Tax=Rhizophlyctis rosea TaxID=64517 RepID=A0AAD5SCC4_9FUNG|nr:hypothetical protein HK097_006919 [Rhizophlyctis rosea]